MLPWPTVAKAGSSTKSTKARTCIHSRLTAAEAIQMSSVGLILIELRQTKYLGQRNLTEFDN
jgi:hypothetical protein